MSHAAYYRARLLAVISRAFEPRSLPCRCRVRTADAPRRRSNPDDTRGLLCGLLLRNVLQQQISVRIHAEMQLQQNAQQTWLHVTQTMLLF